MPLPRRTKEQRTAALEKAARERRGREARGEPSMLDKLDAEYPDGSPRGDDEAKQRYDEAMREWYEANVGPVDETAAGSD